MNVSLDEESVYLAKYNSLKYAFKKDTSESFLKKVRNLLENLPNPFKFFCFCIKNDKEVYGNKIKSFLSQFLLEFERFVADNDDKLRLLLTPCLQLKGFEIFKELRHPVLQNALVSCFSLSSVPHLIVPVLMEELKKGNQISSVSNMVVKLNFQSEFTIHEMVIPLFLQDKIGEIEKFLDFSPSLQIEFLKILDGIVGNQIQISDLLQSCKVKEVKGQKSPKVIYKLGIRFMKKYNINSETCPHIKQRHKLSSLRYLFQKHYIQNELSLESLVLFAKEISEGSSSLKAQVLDLFLEYHDCYSGFIFLQDKNLTDEYIPHQIKILLNSETELEAEKLRHNHQQQIKKLNPGNFYSLSLPVKSIHEIRTVPEFNHALCQLSSYSVIAIDTEWKPTLQYDKEEELMLLQVAAYDRVYLFDMLCLQNLLTSEHWNKLGELFSDASITKLTYSFAGDTKCLGGFNSQLQEHMKKKSNVIDLNETKKILVDSYSHFFLFLNKGSNECSHKGLSEMVYLCFGKPLDKMEQCSYWSARPLSQKQILYAALDAFCLLDIYDYLNRRSKDFNISDWKSLKSDASNTPKASKNVNKKSRNRVGAVQYKEPNPKIFAGAFKVVCDSMLQGLGKDLRSCNIDTVILGSFDYHEKCIELYEKEARVVLTRGNVYHRIRKQIPQSHILCVRNDNVKKQLEEVTTRFGVVIEDRDIFARCRECNSNTFITVNPKVLTKMKSFDPKLGIAPKWVPVGEGKGSSLDVHEGVTDKGVKVQLEEVPYGVLNRVPFVYICDGCGKCYWDGSHLEKVKSNLSHIIRPSVPYTPVPPPPQAK